MPASLNVQLVDQWTQKIAKDHLESLGVNGTVSNAFAALCLSSVCDIDVPDAVDCITDGGNDSSVDAIHVGDIDDGEFRVTIVQSKYVANLEKAEGKRFPRNALAQLGTYVRAIFGKRADLNVNDKLSEKLAEIYSLIDDRCIPRITIVCCNNGLRWDHEGDVVISTYQDYRWAHINHESIVKIQQKQKVVPDGTLRLSGQRISEDYDFIRVLLGKIAVSEVKKLFDTHGDALLDRNIRRYLGQNRVNSDIRRTLASEDTRRRFYFYNNGITAICTTFTQDDAAGESPTIKFKGLQIINGGQTCRTIQNALLELPEEEFNNVHVLFRLYAVQEDENSGALIDRITYATNSQSPVDLSDLKANDKIQQAIKASLDEIGFVYKSKRDDSVAGPNTITSRVAAEAVLAVWREQPHAAKFRSTRLFLEYYDEIFSEDLNGAQVLMAVLILRAVETERKRRLHGRPVFVPYASHFLAMLIGQYLLRHSEISLNDLNHGSLAKIRQSFNEHKDAFYSKAVGEINDALELLGISAKDRLPRIAAQFRRGDLLEEVFTRKPGAKKQVAKRAKTPQTPKRSKKKGEAKGNPKQTRAVAKRTKKPPVRRRAGGKRGGSK